MQWIAYLQERFEYLFEPIGWYAGAGIRDTDLDRIRTDDERRHDFSSARRMLQRVVEQIAKDLLEPRCVARHEAVVRTRLDNPHAFRFGNRRDVL